MDFSNHSATHIGMHGFPKSLPKISSLGGKVRVVALSHAEILHICPVAFFWQLRCLVIRNSVVPVDPRSSQ